MAMRNIVIIETLLPGSQVKTERGVNAQVKQLADMPPVSQNEIEEITRFMDELRGILNAKTLDAAGRDKNLEEFKIISKRLRGQEIRVRRLIAQGVDPVNIPEHVLSHREWQELCQLVDSTIKRLKRAKIISA